MTNFKYRAQRNKVNNMVKYAREQFFIKVNDMLDNEGKSNPKSSSIVILNTSGLRPVRLSKTGVGRSESIISEIEQKNVFRFSTNW
jgi:hypothetical protein